MLKNYNRNISIHTRFPHFITYFLFLFSFTISEPNFGHRPSLPYNRFYTIYYLLINVVRFPCIKMLPVISYCPVISFSSCQRNLIKTFQIEGMIALITKMTLIFSSDLLNGQK